MPLSTTLPIFLNLSSEVPFFGEEVTLDARRDLTDDEVEAAHRAFRRVLHEIEVTNLSAREGKDSHRNAGGSTIWRE
jgi:hypothetical protein